MTETRHSPLFERHLAADARMADFGGFAMPIEFPAGGGGVVAEHTAVREAVGVFDVSHLGTATVRGPGALDFLNRCLTNDLRRIGPGRAQYTFCCDDCGGVVDDLIAYVHAEDDLLLIPNAANSAEVLRRLDEAAPAEIAVTDRHTDFGVLAVQGPRSADLLALLGIPAELGYMSSASVEFAGGPLVVCRTGYTGEHGYELVIGWDEAGALWDRLLEAGAPLGVRPCGLGSRDTLRTEMGYPLHGQDLSLEISPVQAGAGWAVGWSKEDFWGREALIAEREAGPRRRLWGVRAPGRGIPRHGMRVRSLSTPDGDDIGEVTSGTFSPTLKAGIGLALIEASAGVKAGDEVGIDIRGRVTPVTVTTPPFVPSSVR